MSLFQIYLDSQINYKLHEVFSIVEFGGEAYLIGTPSMILVALWVRICQEKIHPRAQTTRSSSWVLSEWAFKCVLQNSSRQSIRFCWMITIENRRDAILFVTLFFWQTFFAAKILSYLLHLCSQLLHVPPMWGHIMATTTWTCLNMHFDRSEKNPEQVLRGLQYLNLPSP